MTTSAIRYVANVVMIFLGFKAKHGIRILNPRFDGGRMILGSRTTVARECVEHMMMSTSAVSTELRSNNSPDLRDSLVAV
jgi:hypothetical protein